MSNLAVEFENPGESMLVFLDAIEDETGDTASIAKLINGFKSKGGDFQLNKSHFETILKKLKNRDLATITDFISKLDKELLSYNHFREILSEILKKSEDNGTQGIASLIKAFSNKWQDFELSKDDFNKILNDLKDKQDAKGMVELIEAFSGICEGFKLSEDQFNIILDKLETCSQSEQDMAELTNKLVEAVNDQSFELTPKLFDKIVRKITNYRKGELANGIKNLLSKLDSNVELSDSFLNDILNRYANNSSIVRQVKIELIDAIRDLAKKYESKSVGKIEETINDILKSMSKSDSNDIYIYDSFFEFVNTGYKTYDDELYTEAEGLLQEQYLNLKTSVERLREFREKYGLLALRSKKCNYLNVVVKKAFSEGNVGVHHVDEAYELMEEVLKLQGVGRAYPNDIYSVLCSVDPGNANIRNTVKLIEVSANLGSISLKGMGQKACTKYGHLPLTAKIVDILLRFCDVGNMDQLLSYLPESESLNNEFEKKAHATEDISKLVDMLVNLRLHARGCFDLNDTLSDKAKEASDKIKLTNDQVNNLLSLYCEVPHNLKEIEALIKNLKELGEGEFKLSKDTTEKVLNSICGEYSKIEIVKFVKSLVDDPLNAYNDISRICDGTQIRISDLEDKRCIKMELVDTFTKSKIVFNEKCCQDILNGFSELDENSYILKMDLIAKLKNNNPDFNPTINVLSEVVVAILSLFTYFRNLLGNVKDENVKDEPEIDKIVSTIDLMTKTTSQGCKSRLEVITGVIQGCKGKDFQDLQNELQQELQLQGINFKEFSDEEIILVASVLSSKLKQNQFTQVIQFENTVRAQGNNKNRITPKTEEIQGNNIILEK